METKKGTSALLHMAHKVSTLQEKTLNSLILGQRGIKSKNYMIAL